MKDQLRIIVYILDLNMQEKKLILLSLTYACVNISKTFLLFHSLSSFAGCHIGRYIGLFTLDYCLASTSIRGIVFLLVVCIQFLSKLFSISQFSYPHIFLPSPRHDHTSILPLCLL